MYLVLLLCSGRRVSARLTQNVTLLAHITHIVQGARVLLPPGLAVQYIRICNNNTLYTREPGQCNFSSIILYY